VVEIQKAPRSSETPREKPSVFVLIGPEGSGKTTEATLLAEKLNLPLIVVGDLLRDRAENDPGEIGQACRDMFAAHAYLDPSLVRKIVAERLSKEDTLSGFVLDGGDRTVEETEHFPETLKLADRSDLTVKIISLRLAGWKSMERLSTRQREDDSVEGSLSRLSRFYYHLGERATFMKKNWNFIQVDAGRSIDEVHADILSKINSQ